MSRSLKTGDKVQVISGNHKGQTAKIVKINRQESRAMLEGIGIRTRRIKPNMLNPRGSKKEIHLGIDLSNLKKVEEKK
ncbi:MAG: KOW motif domain-containing protein [Candidatus Saccharibacteria bacterium]|nr:KOW motif domain-containing protein [Candidatus Saccharibacteria bacterium]